MSAIAKKKPKYVAPGPYLGFGLQTVRLCYYLLSENVEHEVSIELADDVAIHTSKYTIVEQTKSALAQNPVSDWSIDLWKTFANWIDSIKSGHIDIASTYFRLYVAPKHSGNFALQLTSASNDASCEKIVAEIEAALAVLTPKPAAHKYIKKFLQFEPTKRNALIKRFGLGSDYDDPVDALRKLLRATLDPDMVETCCEYAIGKAKETADALIRRGMPARIPCNTFQSEFKAFVRKHDLSGLLTSLDPSPDHEKITKKLAEAPTFVKQLQLVDMPTEQQLRAVSDYLQAIVNKTSWAESGHVYKSSFEEFDESLVRQHQNIYLELSDSDLSSSPKRLGRTLYARCGQTYAPLEGRVVPGHFVSGCFNDLADRQTLGWHPDFKTLLGGK